MAGIFDRQYDLHPSQLRAVAERRFDDAQALCDTGKNKHANGAQYLCGFVIEILLKARLMQKYPAAAAKRSHELKGEERLIWNLIWRSHELVEMLERLLELEVGLAKMGRRDGTPYSRQLKELCGTWTIQARYSTRASDMGEARDMIERVRQLKELIK